MSKYIKDCTILIISLPGNKVCSILKVFSFSLIFCYPAWPHAPHPWQSGNCYLGKQMNHTAWLFINIHYSLFQLFLIVNKNTSACLYFSCHMKREHTVAEILRLHEDWQFWAGLYTNNISSYFAMLQPRCWCRTIQMFEYKYMDKQQSGWQIHQLLFKCFSSVFFSPNSVFQVFTWYWTGRFVSLPRWIPNKTAVAIMQK